MVYYFVKRTFDIIASLVALVISSPLWIIAILGIEISDPGSVFYVANRVGKDNKSFKMLKFRSMRVDKKANEKSLRADKDRIFLWGKFMRDTKIDEIPQLVNILKGEMSFIGPRPASVDQVEITRAGKYAVTAKMKPGLSGPSALYDYIYGDKFEDEAEYFERVLPTRLDLDLYYYGARSISYDFKMLWYTAVCILGLLFHKMPSNVYDELTAAAESIR